MIELSQVREEGIVCRRRPPSQQRAQLAKARLRIGEAARALLDLGERGHQVRRSDTWLYVVLTTRWPRPSVEGREGSRALQSEHMATLNYAGGDL